MPNKVIIEAVDRVQFNAVTVLVASEYKMLREIEGMGKLFQNARTKLSALAAAIVIDAANRNTSKLMNGLVDMLTAEKQNDMAKAMVEWAVSHGFKTAKHPDTKKTVLNTDAPALEKIKAEYDVDADKVVGDLLSKPFHIAIKKANPYKDYSLIERIKQELKRAAKIEKERDDRTEAKVKTDTKFMADLEQFVEKLTNGGVVLPQHQMVEGAALN